MTKFLSEEWVQEAQARVNGDEKFKKLAAKVASTYLYIIEPEPDKDIVDRKYLWFTIMYGKWVDWKLKEANADFTLSGPYGVFVDILRGKIGTIETLARRRFKMKGHFDMIGIMAQADVLNRFDDLLRTIHTDFEGSY